MTAHRPRRTPALARTAAIGAMACLTACSTTRTPPPGRTVAGTSTTPVTPAPAGSAPPAPWPSGAPHPATVNGADPTAVSRAALTIMWTLEYGHDHQGQHDAQLRALPLLSAPYAARIRATQPGAPPPDAWIHDHVHTVVQTQPGDEEHPADTATTAYRQWLMTITTADPAGHHPVPPFKVVAYVTVTRGSGQPWQVADVATFPDSRPDRPGTKPAS